MLGPCNSCLFYSWAARKAGGELSPGMVLAVATAPPLKSSGGLASRLEMPLER